MSWIGSRWGVERLGPREDSVNIDSEGNRMKPFRASYQGGVSEEFYIPMVGEHLVNELTLRKFLG